MVSDKKDFSCYEKSVQALSTLTIEIALSCMDTRDELSHSLPNMNSKPVLRGHSRIDKTKGLKTGGSYACRKYCRMLHSAILLTCSQ